MNLLFLNNYHYLRGGSERVFFGEMELLKKHEHNVSAFARKHPGDVAAEYSNYFPEDIRTDSIQISLDAVMTVKEIIYSKNAKRSLNKLLSHFQPDIAHAHNIYGRLTSSVLDLLYEKNIPILMTLHDYKLICPNYKLLCNGRICEDCKGCNFYMAARNKCHKNSFTASAIYAFEAYFNQLFQKFKKNVRFFIAPSLFLKNKLIDFGWPSEKIKYIPNYLVLSELEPKYAPGKYFLYLGRLSTEKGVSTLIKAFMKIKSDKVNLWIVGEGHIRNQLEKIASADSRIRFTGYLSGNTLKQTSSDALAVIVPSEWYENASISILESFAFGKPVIGSRIGGIPEMVEEGLNGYLFEPGNADDLKDKLELMLSKPKKDIEQMGKAARDKVEKEYNAELHYERLMKVYNKALS